MDMFPKYQVVGCCRWSLAVLLTLLTTRLHFGRSLVKLCPSRGSNSPGKPLCLNSNIKTWVQIKHRGNGLLRQAHVFDYEYVPSGRSTSKSNNENQGTTNFSTLPSSYPSGTPAGLRGEAVRAALRSERCIGWSAKPSCAYFGNRALKLQGRGCTDFLNNRLSQKFVASSEEEKDASCFYGTFQEAALLTSKGRMIDRLGIALSTSDCAYLLPSPGLASPELFKLLDRYVFPLDEVELFDGKSCFQFTLASAASNHVELVWKRDILPLVFSSSSAAPEPIQLPKLDECLVIKLSPYLGEEAELVIFPTVFLPSCAALGFTFLFHSNGACAEALGQYIWSFLISDVNSKGPVEVGPAEWESLRIEAGQPGFGHEMTGHLEKEKDSTTATPASPLELFQDSLLNLDKGCYMGQEGIASMIKNPRGPPRRLYQVIFEDDFNVYDFETANDVQDAKNALENQTRPPRVGDSLCVLGSNEDVVVGVLTSVAEPESTGDRNTVGLSLIRRSDSITSQMQQLGLNMDRSNIIDKNGIILPPPRDPLHGLEVIIKGSFAVGKLQSIPSRRLPAGRNMFVEALPDYALDYNGKNDYYLNDNIIDVTRLPLAESAASANGSKDEKVIVKQDQKHQRLETEKGKTDIGNAIVTKDDDEGEGPIREMERAAEARAAAAEAQRKTEKMELLKKRAEEAMAKRLQNQPPSPAAPKDNESAEAQRKAEKMALLKRQAEEAMERRRKKLQQQQGQGDKKTD